MLRIKSIAEEGVTVDIGFTVQTRVQNSKQLKDTICYGIMQEPADGYAHVTTFVPAIAYQSAKDNFNKIKGKRIALTRFLERNSISQVARVEAWDAFNQQHNVGAKKEKVCIM